MTEENKPSTFKIKIWYMNGESESLECARVTLVDKAFSYKKNTQGVIEKDSWGPHARPYFEIWTKDNLFKVRNSHAVEGIDYDENYTKIVMANQKPQKSNLVTLDGGKDGKDNNNSKV